ADLPASSLVFSARVDVTAQPTLFPYAMGGGALQPFMNTADGTCLGCHVAVSPDGRRIVTGTNGTIPGRIIDAQTRTVVATAPVDSPWSAATFDQKGTLVTAYLGALTLRDGATGAVVAPIATDKPASEPALSTDGAWLASITLESVPNNYFVGDALHVVPWNAATQ